VEKQELLRQYYSHLIALERRAPLTADTYRCEIRRFLDWLEDNKLSIESRTSNHAEFSDVTLYLSFRRTNDHIDSRSTAKAVSALKSFFRFLTDERILSEVPGEEDTSIANRIQLLEAPKTGTRLPTVLKKGDADKLFSLIDTDSPLGIRDCAIYELIYSAGLRISELVSLDLKDLVLSEGIARVTGKGSKERMVVFGPQASFWIKRYLDEVRPVFLKHHSSQAFFVSRRGKRLSRKGIWKNYKTLASMAGIDTKLHTLRHTFATEMLSGGADLRSVQELLGHADLATTQIYTHVDPAYLRENHKQYLPHLKTWSGT